jgi:hypothetical protein
MTSFTKFAAAAVLAASLAPLSAYARSGDLGTTGPAGHAVQSSQHGAYVPGRGAENAQNTQFANNVITSYPDGRPVPSNALASNDVPVTARWVGGAASDSNAG